MNKQKAVQPLTLDYLNSYEAQMRAIKVNMSLGRSPDVTETPECRTGWPKEVLKAIKEGRPY